MKRITIGRNPNSDIYYDMNMVSRSHALLNIYSSGKYEIINIGKNGTKVNGVLIANNRPYPLKRGDVVTFAGQGTLDWSQIPNPAKPWRIAAYIAGGLLAATLITGTIVWIAKSDFSLGSDCDDNIENTDNSTQPAATDSIPVNDSVKADETTPPANNLSVFFNDKNKHKNKNKNNSDKEKPDKNKEKTDSVNGWHR